MNFTKSGLQQMLFAISLSLCAVAAQAGTVAFGPSPYLQADANAADNSTPAGFFDFSHPDCVGFIEDFESGSFDTFLTFSDGRVLEPNFSSGTPGLTDSVDGDGSGVLDGNGNDGYSYFIPNANEVTITFGSTVHAAGLVFTDGDENAIIMLEAYDPMGNLIDTIDAGVLADGSFQGTTGEDRFLGFTDDMTGIGSIRLVQVGGSGIELDHVHWQTECVPEPSTALMGFFAMMGLVGLRRRRR